MKNILILVTLLFFAIGNVFGQNVVSDDIVPSDTLMSNCVFAVDGEDFEKLKSYSKIVVYSDSVHVIPTFEKPSGFKLTEILSTDNSEVGLVYQMKTTNESIEILLMYDESGLFGLAVVNLKTLKEQHYFFDKNL